MYKYIDESIGQIRYTRRVLYRCTTVCCAALFNNLNVLVWCVEASYYIVGLCRRVSVPVCIRVCVCVCGSVRICVR